MPRNAAALAARLTEATATRFRGGLLARGQAQSMIRRAGTLPDDSQIFSPYLDQDLLEYGYSLMSAGLRILDTDRTERSDSDADTTDRETISRNSFLQASYALEAATRNAAPDTPDLGFHRLIAGAASHLAGYAARAFSLVDAGRTSGRLSPMELTLADLLMRDLGSIEDRTLRLRSSIEVTDAALEAAMSRDEDIPDVTLEDSDDEPQQTQTSGPPVNNPEDAENLSDLGPITLLLSEHYLATVAAALLAIALGSGDLLTRVIEDLQLGEDASNDIAAPGPWWVFRLTRHLIADLDSTSIRRNLPLKPSGDDHFDADDDAAGDEVAEGDDFTDGSNEALVATASFGGLWQRLRQTYITTLMARGRAEIDLWPSQLHVVERVFATTDDLVVALPTSAGKTRVAELCILRCLAQKKRAVYVTPLRALSAQTERVLEQTFTPLGFRVSSLYGSMGASDLDGDALKSSHVVVATPEKLDFALRSDPSVLDDVAVIVLDEGHMIGAGEREVRYEAQIQRLLRRADADTRRIICLSAVFPENEQLDDFVNWITDDNPEGLHKEDWRPTRQQFGMVEWRAGGYARMNITIGEEQPFIPRFLEAKAPSGKRRADFPNDQNELTLATAWRLLEEGQTVLIFCPLKRSVATMASTIVKLHRQNLIESVLPDGADIAQAVAVGTEWFGAEHDIVKCLRLGVAIHHGSLPGPFRREIETLLHQRVLKVTVASPTLAQGLNLSASVLLFSSLHRSGQLLAGAEFANVIGRAGRAFVDTEGLVLHPVFEPEQRKRANWATLINGTRSRALESGLIIIGRSLVERMREVVGRLSLPSFLDYLTGSTWTFPVVANEVPSDSEAAAGEWESNLALLDTAILSVIGDEAADPEDVIQVLADTMRNSLWERQMRRLEGGYPIAIRAVVEHRAQFLWVTSTPEQRRGWYLAGLGAAAGHELAEAAPMIVQLTNAVEFSLLTGNTEDAVAELVDLADAVFAVSTFARTATTSDWRALLCQWLSGQSLSEMNESQMVVAEFIEADIIYRLVWGVEAARVYELAQGNPAAELVDGSATAALETGTLSRAAAVLLRSGFEHRSAAIKAVADTGASFTDATGMREWIKTLDPFTAADPAWPTSASRQAWVEFTERVRIRRRRRWREQRLRVTEIEWAGASLEDGELMRVTDGDSGSAILWSPGFDRLGIMRIDLNSRREGVLHGVYGSDGSVELVYSGPEDLLAGPKNRA